MDFFKYVAAFLINFFKIESYFSAYHSLNVAINNATVFYKDDEKVASDRHFVDLNLITDNTPTFFKATA